ncbi:FAD-dependent oxidoreductase [Streptomyces sp. NBC_01216]|uniref:NAD(P)/FAD-dependent oxidoreductase n=1 Tax=Streptomyces sp. NBC_01216 TaxID=2903778 RepID=UPI002E108788|nr:FAD-dependent oxidoreductase [Streptomyces sp. NBC_01216]
MVRVRYRAVDVLVVGAGPAGLSAAARLATAGAGRVEVLERERTAGGAPRYSAHGGFGGAADGPAYARRAVAWAVRAGATLRTGVSATDWAGPLTLEITGPAGRERITARAVILATGARERPRSARLVPGSRPSGVLTTGELLQSVHLHGMRRERLGRRAVVVGAEPVARHAVATLRHAGLHVAALVTDLPRGAERPGTVHRPPLLTDAAVTELVGRGRLTGVRVRHGDGRPGLLRCDTVVFTGDWMPDHELARSGGVLLDGGTRGPAVDGAFRTASPGVFAVGNVLRGVEPAVWAAAEGHAAAESVLRLLAGGEGDVTAAPVVVEDPLRWVSPNRISRGGHGRPFLLRAARPLSHPVVTVEQEGRVLCRRTVRGVAQPWRSVRLAPDWARAVDPAGGPVVVRAGDGEPVG